jgi:hypothetical protein
MTKLQQRIAAEKAITKALCKAILAEGYKIRVFDGEDWHKNQTVAQAVENAMAVDESRIYAYTVNDENKAVYHASWFMVYGNDGYDVICDYSVNELTDKIDKVLQPLCDKWEKKLG